jgi:hypothetical protein
MAEAVQSPFKQRLGMAGAIVGVIVTLNIVFWIGTSFYYGDKDAGENAIAYVRVAFGVLSLVVAAAAYLAALAPKVTGFGLAGVLSVSSLVGGVSALAKGMPPVMGITMLVVGLLVPPLIWKSLHRSRAAWSFLIALVAVFGVVTFFGAPKIRNILGTNLWYALLLPGLKAVCVISLAMLRDEYRD